MVCVRSPDVAACPRRATASTGPVPLVAVRRCRRGRVGLRCGVLARLGRERAPCRRRRLGQRRDHTAKVTFSSRLDQRSRRAAQRRLRPRSCACSAATVARCARSTSAGRRSAARPTAPASPATHPAYWAYFRALAGATQYTYSLAGAGLTQVHDGDVEAWTWGTGSPPSRFVSFADVWGPDPPPTTRPAVTAPPTTHPPSPRHGDRALGLRRRPHRASQGFDHHDDPQRRTEGRRRQRPASEHRRRRHDDDETARASDRRRRDSKVATAPVVVARRRRLALRSHRLRRDARRAGRRDRLRPPPPIGARPERGARREAKSRALTARSIIAITL